MKVAAAALVFIPSTAMSQCGTEACSVGAAGTGGESSDGKAQGFHYEFPSTRFPGATITNSGNNDAGRFSIGTGATGSTLGTLSGTFRAHPSPSSRGRGTGLFGDWTGQCQEVLAFEDC